MRGELTERSFAHLYESGGMRRVHLRGRENILKRVLVHAGAFDLGLVMRKLFGAGTPRQWEDAKTALIILLNAVFTAVELLRHRFLNMAVRPSNHFSESDASTSTLTLFSRFAAA